MKYSTFTKLVEGVGLKVSVHDDGLTVYDPETGNTMLSIDKESTFTFSTNYREFEKLSDHDKQIFLDWAIKLASTPIADRENEKRYRLKLNIPFVEQIAIYLNKRTRESGFLLSNKTENSFHQTIFTESEVKELKQKHNLDSFIMEEVNEDE